MNKNKMNVILSVLGASIFALGLYWVKTIPAPVGGMKALPYLMIGVGCGAFGHGMGDIIGKKAMKANPEIAKQIAIDQKDERNVTISDKSKAKAYDSMLIVFGALQLAFALMNVDLMIILLMVMAYLFVVGYGIYYRVKYEKEM